MSNNYINNLTQQSKSLEELIRIYNNMQSGNTTQVNTASTLFDWDIVSNTMDTLSSSTQSETATQSSTVNSSTVSSSTTTSSTTSDTSTSSATSTSKTARPAGQVISLIGKTTTTGTSTTVTTSNAVTLLLQQRETLAKELKTVEQAYNDAISNRMLVFNWNTVDDTTQILSYENLMATNVDSVENARIIDKSGNILVNSWNEAELDKIKFVTITDDEGNPKKVQIADIDKNNKVIAVTNTEKIKSSDIGKTVINKDGALSDANYFQAELQKGTFTIQTHRTEETELFSVKVNSIWEDYAWKTDKGITAQLYTDDDAAAEAVYTAKKTEVLEKIATLDAEIQEVEPDFAIPDVNSKAGLTGLNGLLFSESGIQKAWALEITIQQLQQKKLNATNMTSGESSALEIELAQALADLKACVVTNTNSNTVNYQTTYDEQGNPTTTFCNSSGTKLAVASYQKDASGKITTSSYTTFDSNGNGLDVKTTTYDTNGKSTTKTQKYDNSGASSTAVGADERITYFYSSGIKMALIITYDANGKEISRDFKRA